MEETRKDRIQLLVRRNQHFGNPGGISAQVSEKHDSFYDCCHYYILVFQNVSQFMAVCQHCGTL